VASNRFAFTTVVDYAENYFTIFITQYTKKRLHKYQAGGEKAVRPKFGRMREGDLGLGEQGGPLVHLLWEGPRCTISPVVLLRREGGRM
jgi:hypothetical protein